MDINSDKVRSDIHTEFKKKHKPIGPEPVPVPAPGPRPRPTGYGVNVYSEIPCPIIGTVYYDDYLLPIQAKDAAAYYQANGGNTIIYNGRSVEVTFLDIYMKNPITTPFDQNPINSTIVPTGSDLYIQKIN